MDKKSKSVCPPHGFFIKKAEISKRSKDARLTARVFDMLCCFQQCCFQQLITWLIKLYLTKINFLFFL